MSKSPEVWYRYDDVQYAASDYDDGYRHGPGETRVELSEYGVVRHTPKGVWVCAGPSWSSQAIDSMHGYERFVLISARKRLCYATKEEAMTSFIARKKAQIRIYKAKIARAERALAAAARMDEVLK